MKRNRKRKGSLIMQRHFRIIRKYVIEMYSLAKYYKNNEDGD